MYRTSYSLLTMLLLAGCGAATSGSTSSAAGPGGDAAELEAIFWARLDSTRANYTEADVRFLTGMIAHHAQAMVMAELAEQRSASPSIRTLAARIINGQGDEIDVMRQWLADRGQPVPEVPSTVHAAAQAAHADHGRHAAGMLSPEQLHSLERESGPAFDRLLLTLMIEHHRGAVAMVHELFGADGAAQDPTLFKLASDIQADQLTEIRRMERMLAQIPSEAARTP